MKRDETELIRFETMNFTEEDRDGEKERVFIFCKKEKKDERNIHVASLKFCLRRFSSLHERVFLFTFRSLSFFFFIKK